MENCFIIFNRTKWESEKKTLISLADTLTAQAASFGKYRILVGYYVAPEGGRQAFEVDALLVCRHGLVIIEMKNFRGQVDIPDVSCDLVIQRANDSKKEYTGIINAIRDRCSGLLTHLKQKATPRATTLGLLLFTHVNCFLRIGSEGRASYISGEVGIGKLREFPQLLAWTARRVAETHGRQFQALSDNQVLLLTNLLHRGQPQEERTERLRIGSYVLEDEIPPFEGRPAGYRLYRGYELRTNFRVLVKEMRLSDLVLLNDPEPGLDRLAQAAAALRNLDDHKHIAKFVAQVEADDGTRVYHVFGIDRAAPLSQYCSAPLARRLALLAQTARALAFVHEHGLIHRAINPYNVVVVNDTTAKLMNFDLARVPNRYTVVREARQQPIQAYLSPELRNADKPEDVDWRCDSFSFGVVAFELMSGGVIPFETTRFATEANRLTDHVRCSASLAAIIEACLEEDAGRRPGMAQLADAFEQEVIG